MQNKNIGTFYAVGVGPGDPELLTQKATRILNNVPVICTPVARTSAESYALSIVRGAINLDNKEIITSEFPTDDESAAQSVWKEAANSIIQHLNAGTDVAFITEGDPMIYSTVSYVLEVIRDECLGVTIEVIPGISSPMAAASSAGIPLVKHGQKLAILPYVYGIDDLREAISNYDTIVLMKVNKLLLGALSNLEQLGLLGRTTYVRRASTDTEKIVRNLNDLTEEDLDYFSLLIIRKGE
ncbi:MAG TPA: precorrin-2 C(20)-methyltransferase [Dehalococcoidia bacterium]|jgi:precorrin-2/cobalt-factor-2 C20-methyltransferase|nr:precorrin-2 C(20)-methyltransferase [Dehalococcoidia bacterium]|tara:strand:- start:22 stop:741 length:720 start_codon:yes stop_codon:yes gene_type:complete